MKVLLFALLSVLFINCSLAQSGPMPRYEDRIRIREAITISKKFGDKLWKGYKETPFTMVLVTDSFEFLINHPNPSTDFMLSGRDEILNTDVYYRKRVFNKSFLATFRAVNNIDCIVAGIPENTIYKTSGRWIITMLHEHFHQYQNADPNYTKDVNGLNLTGGDQTGMWMLNYAFPYDSLPVKNQYELYARSLYNAVTNSNTQDYKSNLQNYFQERKKLKEILPPSAYRYFSFQIWQEGIARYTEYKFTEMLAGYLPSKEVLALPDFTSFTDVKGKIYSTETQNLLDNKINEARRVCFYSIGFAEGLLLDKLNKKWRGKYLYEKFFIEKYAKQYQ